MTASRVLRYWPFLGSCYQCQLVQVFDVVPRIEGGDAPLIDGTIPSSVGTAFADSSPAFGQE